MKKPRSWGGAALGLRNGAGRRLVRWVLGTAPQDQPAATPPRPAPAPPPRQILLGEPSDPGLLGTGDGSRRPAEPVVEPDFHFHEPQDPAIFSNEVDFPAPRPVVAFQDPVTARFQKPGRHTLAFFPQRATPGHGHPLLPRPAENCAGATYRARSAPTAAGVQQSRIPCVRETRTGGSRRGPSP